MTAVTADKTQPALFGGLVMGALSALPIVSAGNLCCCLWVVSGGVVAAYFLQQNQSAPVTQGDGALVGLYAGVVGAVIETILYIPISLLTAPFEGQVIERIRNMSGVSPEFDQVLALYTHPGMRVVRTFVIALIFGAVFSTIGGLVGAMIFRKQTPPGVIDVPPQA